MIFGHEYTVSINFTNCLQDLTTKTIATMATTRKKAENKNVAFFLKLSQDARARRIDVVLNANQARDLVVVGSI